MERRIKAGRIFYGLALAAIGIQQFIFRDLSVILFPPIHTWILWNTFWAYLSGMALIVTGIALVFNINARIVSLFVGYTFLILLVFFYIPYELFFDPNSRFLGVWVNAGKELALAGGAFIVCKSLAEENTIAPKHFLIKFLEKVIPLGSIFFSITMISFGIDHFLYTQVVASTVPVWIPNKIFWTYFAAFALIGSSIAIILKIELKIIASLLGIMIFLWLIGLHIPRTINHPYANMGAELSGAISALAFSGIAFVISGEKSIKLSENKF